MRVFVGVSWEATKRRPKRRRGLDRRKQSLLRQVHPQQRMHLTAAALCIAGAPLADVTGARPRVAAATIRTVARRFFISWTRFSRV